PGMNAPNEMYVVQCVARLQQRELTAEALVRSCLSRIAEREPQVQAWEILAQDAIDQARRIDAQPRRPLLCGLPVGIKDLMDTASILLRRSRLEAQLRHVRPARRAPAGAVARHVGILRPAGRGPAVDRGRAFGRSGARAHRRAAAPAAPGSVPHRSVAQGRAL